MPDWSYRTVLRPVMNSLGAERSQRLATGVLAALSRLPLGLRFIDFLGHMRADERLRRRVGGVDVPGPIALGSLIDPKGRAVAAFARFGCGLIEVGPVSESNIDEVEANLARARLSVHVCIRIAASDGQSARRIALRLKEYAAFFIGADAEPNLTWLRGNIDETIEATKRVRAADRNAVIVAGGVTEPEDARRLLEAGADFAAIDQGLISSGPGLIKRCNEALLSELPSPAPPEPLTLDAARRSWFWALILGIGMVAGGVLALIIASTRVVLPYDEALCGMTRTQIMSLNPRLLPFMAHDRVSLAGTMISIGILYAAFAWFGIRRGAHWAHVAVIVSAIAGFFSFFFFLGFGYFDPFHAFVTAVLTQFTLLCMAMAPSPAQPNPAEWHETAAWRRAQWGQLLFVLIGATITGAGLVISFIGCTSVFVATDLEFMRTTAAQLHASYETLVPLVAHDRASLGGMLLANGIAIWLAAQWGFRAGARWLWHALAWAGNIAFASAVIVHFAVGYDAGIHLAPALLGWVAWNVALGLTRGWMASPRALSAPRLSEPVNG